MTTDRKKIKYRTNAYDGKIGKSQPRKFYAAHIVGILKKDQILSARNRRACIERLMDVSEAREIVKCVSPFAHRKVNQIDYRGGKAIRRTSIRSTRRLCYGRRYAEAKLKALATNGQIPESVTATKELANDEVGPRCGRLDCSTKMGPAQPARHHTLAEYRREAAASAVTLLQRVLRVPVARVREVCAHLEWMTKTCITAERIASRTAGSPCGRIGRALRRRNRCTLQAAATARPTDGRPPPPPLPLAPDTRLVWHSSPADKPNDAININRSASEGRTVNEIDMAIMTAIKISTGIGIIVDNVVGRIKTNEGIHSISTRAERQPKASLKQNCCEPPQRLRASPLYYEVLDLILSTSEMIDEFQLKSDQPLAWYGNYVKQSVQDDVRR
ncbi:hypothetical protein EVAR_75269_1 [Eumeta japonica]|uniref:Uncharacterized protein n=1 Tax=Eumeta variegata TaxID=151549 RepID=A0A4C1V904_EUMVA|nr:hypothetical protein EVAR_75269_1 [Eumeta japonica]